MTLGRLHLVRWSLALSLARAAPPRRVLTNSPASFLLKPRYASRCRLSESLKLTRPTLQLDALVHSFIAHELPFLPIFHVPSFRARYQSFNPPHDSKSQPFFLALLLAIAGWSEAARGAPNSQGSAMLEGAMDALTAAE